MWIVCNFIFVFSEQFGEVFFSFQYSYFIKFVFTPGAEEGMELLQTHWAHGFWAWEVWFLPKENGAVSKSGEQGVGQTNASASFLPPVKLLKDQVRSFFTQHSVQRKTSPITVNRWCLPQSDMLCLMALWGASGSATSPLTPVDLLRKPRLCPHFT